MIETWKPIKGYKKSYFISNLGNVKNANERVITQRYNRNGYLRVTLFLCGQEKRLMVNRLVAQHFKRNPDKLPIVNHKNGNKADNRASNLEWVTQSDNIKHAWRTGLIKRKQKLAA